jgi:ABC-type phosphate transport system auxiliary subunit
MKFRNLIEELGDRPSKPEHMGKSIEQLIKEMNKLKKKHADIILSQTMTLKAIKKLQASGLGANDAVDKMIANVGKMIDKLSEIEEEGEMMHREATRKLRGREGMN